MDGTLMTPIHCLNKASPGALQCAATRRSSVVGERCTGHQVPKNPFHAHYWNPSILLLVNLAGPATAHLPWLGLQR